VKYKIATFLLFAGGAALFGFGATTYATDVSAKRARQRMRLV
jgi:hypothetical protein